MPKSQQSTLRLEDIIVDWSWNVRVGLDEDTVQTYMACYEELPPCEVWRLPDGRLVLVDGFHRVEAARRLERATVAVHLYTGTPEEARERSILANLRHGKRYTVEERRRAVREWLRLHAEWADNYVAAALRRVVTAPTVRAVRLTMEAAGEIPAYDRLLGADGKLRPREYAPAALDEGAPPTVGWQPPDGPPGSEPGRATPFVPAPSMDTADLSWPPRDADLSPRPAATAAPLPRALWLPPAGVAPAPAPLPPAGPLREGAWIIQANARHMPLADESVHVEIVSPPYYGMREYKDVPPTVWGGDPTCVHVWDTALPREVGGPAVDGGAFCQHCGAWCGVLGLEPSLDLYVAHLADVLNGEAWRVLRPDGTLWVNIGDTYAGDDKWGGATGGKHAQGLHGNTSIGRRRRFTGLQSGDLMAVPWRVGLALQGMAVLPGTTLAEWAAWLDQAQTAQDWSLVELVKQRIRLGNLVEVLQRGGRWRLRSEIIWAKGVSGQKELTRQVYLAAIGQGVDEETATALAESFDPYVGNPMPFSGRGVRWERHRIKISDPLPTARHRKGQPETADPRRQTDLAAEYVDCPGCPRCAPFGGYVLRRGNWRPTGSFEVVLMFSKAARYYCDGEAVREEYVGEYTGNAAGFRRGETSKYQGQPTAYGQVADSHRPNGTGDACTHGGRNLRAVWMLPLRAYRHDHYATFPAALPELCIKAGTSEAGVCPRCGAPWARVVERTNEVNTAEHGKRYTVGKTAVNLEGRAQEGPRYLMRDSGLFWPTCACDANGLELQPDDMEFIWTPQGERVAEDPTMLTGRAGLNRPRGPAEGAVPITRYEQRHYAAQLRESPHRDEMAEEAGGATTFAHYLRTDKSGARPVPPDLLERWLARGWLTRVEVPHITPFPPVPATVLDFFCGSGTTVERAVALGRRGVGLDLSGYYLDRHARARLAEEPPVEGVDTGEAEEEADEDGFYVEGLEENGEPEAQ